MQNETENSAQLIEKNSDEYLGFTTTPATFINRFFVATNENLVKVAFGERFDRGGATSFRSAVALLSVDAQALAFTLLGVMGQSGLVPKKLTIEISDGGEVVVSAEES